MWLELWFRFLARPWIFSGSWSTFGLDTQTRTAHRSEHDDPSMGPVQKKTIIPSKWIAYMIESYMIPKLGPILRICCHPISMSMIFCRQVMARGTGWDPAAIRDHPQRQVRERPLECRSRALVETPQGSCRRCPSELMKTLLVDY